MNNNYNNIMENPNGDEQMFENWNLGFEYPVLNMPDNIQRQPSLPTNYQQFQTPANATSNLNQIIPIVAQRRQQQEVVVDSSKMNIDESSNIAHCSFANLQLSELMSTFNLSSLGSPEPYRPIMPNNNNNNPMENPSGDELMFDYSYLDFDYHVRNMPDNIQIPSTLPTNRQQFQTPTSTLPNAQQVKNGNGGLSTIANQQASWEPWNTQNMLYRPPYLIRSTQYMKALNEGLPNHIYQSLSSQSTGQNEVEESSMANQQQQASPSPLFLHYQRVQPVLYITTTNLQYQSPFTQNSRGNPVAWQSNEQNNNIPQMLSSQF